MAEYIDREKLTNALDELCDRVCAYTPVQRQFMCGSCSLGCAIEMFEDFPSADVKPMKHARWISIGHKLSRICSVCNCDEPYKFADDDANVYDYCPNCGAKMDGGENG